jgi:hypothetical protein
MLRPHRRVGAAARRDRALAGGARSRGKSSRTLRLTYAEVLRIPEIAQARGASSKRWRPPPTRSAVEARRRLEALR